MVSLWAAAPHSCGTLSLGIGAMQLLLDPGEEREARDDPAPLDIESWGCAVLYAHRVVWTEGTAGESV